MCVYWGSASNAERNPLFELLLPLLLFELNNPALEPLFALPPRWNQRLLELTKLELSLPQDWLLLETD